MSLLRTFRELRDNVASTVRDTAIQTLVDNAINLTLSEIHNFHPWTFLRRKTTFSTVASQEDYNLDEEIDRIALIRQLTTDRRIIYVPDSLFYRLVPNPEDLATGTPRYYRLWEETGFSTNLAAADTVEVLSSSSSDGSGFNVVIVGRESTNNLIVSEQITLNGTTVVTSSTTWAASGLMRCSKSAITTGTITIRRASDDTALARLAPEELAPRFKRLSFYPIPNAAITIYLEYFERFRPLRRDADVPQMDYQWNWVAREGALAKIWDYKQNEAARAIAQRNYEQGLLRMRREDDRNVDFIPVLEPYAYPRLPIVRKHADSADSAFPQYAVSLP